MDRTYPTFGPDDDDFHDEVLSDRWWENETQWFSWNVPERGLGGWTYGWARANAGICGGGAWVWDTTDALSWDLPYHADYTGLRLPPRAERDLRDFAWPTGVHVRAVEPLTTYEIRYDDAGALELDLRFEALMAPNPHPVGVAPFYKGTHFDQPGRVTGTMVLHGERITVDCFATRDRSWGPRPQGPPSKRKPSDAQLLAGIGGIGYSFGTASPSSSFLVYTVPTATDDPVVCGYLLCDGAYAHILGGTRRVELDPEHGWPARIEVEARDDQGRDLRVVGHAVSRHWRGNGGDTLMHWKLDGADAWGEDQTYLSKATLQAWRAR
jgi:hypothetical protein